MGTGLRVSRREKEDPTCSHNYWLEGCTSTFFSSLPPKMCGFASLFFSPRFPPTQPQPEQGKSFSHRRGLHCHFFHSFFFRTLTSRSGVRQGGETEWDRYRFRGEMNVFHDAHQQQRHIFALLFGFVYYFCLPFVFLQFCCWNFWETFMTFGPFGRAAEGVVNFWRKLQLMKGISCGHLLVIKRTKFHIMKWPTTPTNPVCRSKRHTTPAPACIAHKASTSCLCKLKHRKSQIMNDMWK